MDGRRLSAIALLISVMIAGVGTVAYAQTKPPRLLDTLYAKDVRIDPLKDDAGLNDVQFLGEKTGWVVGHHGVVWNSNDGGATWNLVPVPTNGRLNSVCFLTDRIGWVAGGRIVPYSGHSEAILLGTKDGGKTWSKLPVSGFPEINKLQMFDLKNGIAVGHVSSQSPGGILKTADGGQTWEPVSGTSPYGWNTAHFFDGESGFVAGDAGSQASVGGGKLLASLNQQESLKGYRDVVIHRDGTGCLVGDGGTILLSNNGGVTWKTPEIPFPLNLRSTSDFQCVAKSGAHIWVAGQPGSIIWHSMDSGQSWQRQMTGITSPIQKIQFVNEQTGWAVGSFGTILKTTNGGRDWQVVHGKKRHLAMLAFPAKHDAIPFQLLTAYSLDEGFRSGICLLVRNDRPLDRLRLKSATSGLGAGIATIDWPLPFDRPDLDLNQKQLVDYWNKKTDGKLVETVLSRIVLKIRTLRPKVVIIDQSEETALHRMLADAILLAVEQAADATRFVEHQAVYNLSPWQVKRVVARKPNGTFSPLNIEPDNFLPRVGTTVANAMASSRSLLQNEADSRAIMPECYQWDKSTAETAANTKHLFAGLGIMPGSASRRSLDPIDAANLEARQKLARHQRNFRQYTSRFLHDPRHAAQLPAQLRDILSDATRPEAAIQLASLARAYRDYSEFELAAELYQELVERYPDEPVSLEAMQWLIQYYSSQEIGWQQLRVTNGGQQIVKREKDALKKEVQKVLDQVDARNGERLNEIETVKFEASPKLETLANTSRQQALRTQLEQFRQQQAVKYVKLLKAKSQETFQQPGIQFPVASLMRQRRSFSVADGLYRKFSRSKKQGWHLAAQSELWMLNPLGLPPKSLVLVRRAAQPPVLDAVLSDDCWQLASEINLTSTVQQRESLSTEEQNDAGLFLTAYDDRFFYLAASIPKHPEVSYQPVQQSGREYDATMRGVDRLSFVLDIDRDYTTYYRMNVDQRGQTQDACWEDTRWNPKWYVAAEDDETHWRIEVAIPWNELTENAPGRGDVWAAGITRIIPAVGLQSWTHPASQIPKPDTFGLLKFE